ncbi:YidC/Oxa1 family membrane protein insertase [Patescibacteria group bacterium]|nr:YidC/Oxa1 family membrane protein insertase [Patescibacteria group bacterium]MBU2633338.1 YidC/Oxa1 family membrane protein insertase [Patescibacteria group bacterium]
MIGEIYNIIFYQPLYNGFAFLVDVIPFHNVGVAIVVLTLLVRFILFPLSHKSVVTQRKMKQIEPELSEIKEKFKKNKEEQAKQTMTLYRAHGISPFSSFFLLFLQFPVFIALFMILKNGTVFNPDLLYSFVKMPENIGTVFLGIIDVTRSSYFVSFLAGFSQFVQIHLSMPKVREKIKDNSFKGQLQRSMGVQMKYIMPVFIFFIAQRFSSGMALYWTTSNVFAILHEIVVARKSKNISQKNDGKNKHNQKIDRELVKQTND